MKYSKIIENHSERRVKTPRTNNGGEYTSKEFESFCKDVRIKRELTTPYNPQQNGVAERKNIAIMEVVKTMIYDQDLLILLWVEATRTVVYVQGRISHSAIGFKTVEEMFMGKKLEVSHLKIFGCPVYVHIPKEKRTKLDPSGKKGIFVGYCEVSKAFRIYIPGFHHMDISRDVTFYKELSLNISRKLQHEEVYEEDAPPRNIEATPSPEEETSKDHDMLEPQEPPTMNKS